MIKAAKQSIEMLCCAHV